MDRVVIKSVEFSKNPVNVSETFTIAVEVYKIIEETVKISNDLKSGTFNAGKTILKKESFTN